MSGEGLNPEQPSVEIKEREIKEPAMDALVVFGFGIKSDSDLENADMLNPDIPRTARQRLPLGAKLRTAAAAELFFDGEVGDVIFTGGAVKAKEGVAQTEASLMENYFIRILEKRKRAQIYDRLRGSNLDPNDQKVDVDKEVYEYLNSALDHVVKEDKATNTIENFSNTINLLQRKKEEYKRVGLLSSQFHLNRIAELARKHLVEGQPFSADSEVARRRPKYQKIIDNYFTLDGNNRFHEEVLSDYDSADDINDVETKYPGYGSWTDKEKTQNQKRLGTSYSDYLKGERRWSKALDELPEYWMQGLQFIEDENHLRAILAAEQDVAKVLESKLGKSVDEASQEEIQQALASTEREMGPAEWAEQGEALSRSKILIYSDVDGTFKQPGYSENSVKASIKELGEKGIVILNSSWSTDGLRGLQKEYGLDGPVIGENGGEICIPKNFIDIKKVIEVVGGKYPVYEQDGNIYIQIGEDINPIIERFNQNIRQLFHGKTEITGEISSETQMRVFGVDRAEAEKQFKNQPEARKNAKFVLGMATETDPSPEQLELIVQEAEKIGIKITRARYLWHIMGSGYDKGVASELVTKIFRLENPNIQSIGVGDAENDIEMLRSCDRGYLVGDMDISKFPVSVVKTKQNGPEGWREMVQIENEKFSEEL